MSRGLQANHVSRGDQHFHFATLVLIFLFWANLNFYTTRFWREILYFSLYYFKPFDRFLTQKYWLERLTFFNSEYFHILMLLILIKLFYYCALLKKKHGLMEIQLIALLSTSGVTLHSYTHLCIWMHGTIGSPPIPCLFLGFYILLSSAIFLFSIPPFALFLLLSHLYWWSESGRYPSGPLT